MRRLATAAALALAACGSSTVTQQARPPSHRPMRDHDIGTTTTTPPTTTTQVHGRPQPARAARSTSPSRGGHRTASAPITSGTGPCGGWRALVAEFPRWDIDRVCRIMGCESGYNPNARNGIYRGLMQIAHGPLDARQNITQAHAMWRARGYRPWACR